ncbi:hypothetical protein HGRIS_000780 [Hohenbuehelia grisea]|uniref:F-box domain-containing protein n=1 Tax=Hohenbuehelia grisea TaxID=104357 RepID=A0ABR3IPU7_9AGAR
MSSTMTINSIPPELLGEIFCQCTASYAESPLVLSAVSSHFRTVVCATPRAWTRLRLRVGAASAYHQSKRAEQWFRMAKDCTVNVFVDVVSLDGEEVDTSEVVLPSDGRIQSSSSLLPVLRSHIPQIRTLVLRSSTEALLHSYLALLYPENAPVRLDILQHLTVSITEDIPPTPSTAVSALLSPAPPPIIAPFPAFTSLETLRLTNHFLPNSPQLLSNLRHFHFKRPLRAPPVSLTDVFGLLTHAPQMVTLDLQCRTLDDQVPPEDDAEPASDILLSDLSHLSLRCNNIEQLLNRLALPALSSLSIDDLDSHSPEQHLGAALRGLLVRSALVGYRAGLKHLDLTNVAMCPARRGRVGEDAATWEWCFARMSALESISLTSGEGSEHLGLLNLLVRGSLTSFLLDHNGRSRIDGQGIVCPRLKRLTLSAPFVIDPFAADTFRMCRPGAELTLREVADDVIPFAIFASFGLVDPLGPRGPGTKPGVGQGRRGGFGFGSMFDRRRKVKGDEGKAL